MWRLMSYCLNHRAFYSFIWFVQMADLFKSEVSGSLWMVHWIIWPVRLEVNHYHQTERCMTSTHQSTARAIREQTAHYAFESLSRHFVVIHRMQPGLMKIRTSAYCTFCRSFKEKCPLSGAETQVKYVNPDTFLLHRYRYISLCFCYRYI